MKIQHCEAGTNYFVYFTFGICNFMTNYHFMKHVGPTSSILYDNNFNNLTNALHIY